jgi:nitric oxide reductase NorD protein
MTSSTQCFDMGPGRPNLTEPQPASSAARRLSAEDLEDRLDEVLFASQSRRTTTDLAEGLADLPRVQQDLVLHWTEVATQTYAEAAWLLPRLALRALRLLDAEEFGAWVVSALDAYDCVGARAAIEKLRALDAYCSSLKRVDVAVEFGSEEMRLSRLLQGLSGRPLGLRVGVSAWTDTETVYLPARMDTLPTAEENRRLYKATVALLWAQTRHGTFGSATLDLEASLSHFSDRDRALEWLAALEAVRLEARIAEELPGLAAEISRLHGPWPDALLPFVPRLNRPGATLTDSLALLEECVQAPAPTLPHAGRLDPAAALAVRSERIAKDMKVLRRALSTMKALGGMKPGNDEDPSLVAEGREGTPSEATIEGDLQALPPEGRAAARSLVQDLGEIPPECLVPAGPGPYDPNQPPLGTNKESVLPPTSDYSYDEWDYHRHAYRKLWCHLYEHDVRPGDAQYVAEVKQRYSGLIAQIRRRFEALRGETRMLGRQPDGEEIDVDAQVEARTDRKAGVEPSSRLFCRRIRYDRSLAAMFMVDMSGSTRGWINDAEREALVMLCEALDTLGDAYAIYGFSGWTRTRCDIYRIKGFEQPYDEAVKRRIAAIEARDYTRMGVAVRHLTDILLKQPARHRLLVTLSDGRPDDFGDEYRGQYGIEDTRRALQEAHARGVRGYCVTLDRHGADYLAHMYGPAGYTVLDDVKKLPLKVAEIYRRLAT